MPEEKPPTESSPTSASPPPVEAEEPALPVNRFELNPAPNEHIPRDTPLVLREAAAGTDHPDPATGLGSTPPHYVELPGEQPLDIPVATDAVAGTAPVSASSKHVEIDIPQKLTSIAIETRVTNAALSSTTGAIEPPLQPLAGSSRGQVSARGVLTLTPEPVTIVPTPYPADPIAPLVVHGFVNIDPQSAAFLEFSAKIDELAGHLTK